jgi:hypothetical protein
MVAGARCRRALELNVAIGVELVVKRKHGA